MRHRVSQSGLLVAGSMVIAALLATTTVASADALRDKWCSKVHVRFFVGGAEGDAFGTIVYNGAKQAPSMISVRRSILSSPVGIRRR